ncbi:MAG: membrane protein insertase YidC [Treponema sp.]|nr:membrane protein insertase YidC [Candidatus Treponema merdequi]
MGKILSTVIIYPLTQIIETAYVFFYRFFKNPGISVIGVSLTVTLLCLPLYIVAERWQQIQRDTEAKLNPRVNRIKKAFKGDEQYMMLNTYYRQNHYHPLMALRSSFGLLIQIPFFIAAYGFLSNMQALKGQSFLFIRDMGAPDALFSIGSFSVNILPIAMTLINIIAGAIYTKGFAVKEKVQIYGMALVFLVLLYTSPSGLVLYWTMNNVFSLIKNIFYKLKNPLKVLYGILCAAVLLMDVYLIFFFSRSSRITYLRIAAVIGISCLLLIPYLVKAFNYLVKTVLNPLVKDKKIRFTVFIFSAIGCALLTGMVLPGLLISSSVQEFADIAGHSNPDFYVYNSLLQAAGLFIFWPVCIYFLFHDRVQTLITVLLCCFLVCGLINAFAFTGTYGILTQWLIFDAGLKFDSAAKIILNIVLIVFAVSLILILMKFYPKVLSSITSVLVTGVLIFGIVNLVKINSAYRQYKNSSSNVLTENQKIEKDITLSSNGKNVIVIMLDRAISAYTKEIFDEYPALYSQFKGFELYPNTLSFNGHTLTGSPPLFGGYEYSPRERLARKDKNQKELHNEALLVMPRVFTEQADFSAQIADLPWANWSWYSDMSITNPYDKIEGKNLARKYNQYWNNNNPKFLRNDDLLDKVYNRDFFWFALFREMPLFLRPFIYYDGTWWNSENISKSFPYNAQYPELDYLSEMTSVISDNSNIFLSFDNEVTHDKDRYDAPLYVPSSGWGVPGTSPLGIHFSFGSNAAAIHRLGEWFEFLQQNNCYDNSRIIIVSDHGAGNEEYPPVDYGYDNPLIEGISSLENHKNFYNAFLMVKDFNSQDTLKINPQFMTNADVPLIAFDSIIESPVNPFTGKAFSKNEAEKIKENGVEISTSRLWNIDEVENISTLPLNDNDWVRVKENIFDSKNWTVIKSKK